MRRNFFLFLFVPCFVIPAFYFSYSKKDDPNAYRDIHTRLIIPFDTSRVLELMHIADHLNKVSFFLDENLLPKYKSGAFTLKTKIDTIDMRDMRWACDCPNWRYADSVRQDFSGANDFYIEPASPDLKLPEGLGIAARIRFIGREYIAHGYPEHPDFIDPDPPKGKVFRYYAYKIYKPFYVYWPETNVKDWDGYYQSTRLIVK
jgi:hypothetical protein